MKHSEVPMVEDNNNAELRIPVQVRLDDAFFQRLEGWRRSQPTIPSRSMAVRALLERALAQETATA
jgi:hypothetical protein